MAVKEGILVKKVEKSLRGEHDLETEVRRKSHEELDGGRPVEMENMAGMQMFGEMWKKKENAEQLVSGKHPSNIIGLLCIVESVKGNHIHIIKTKDEKMKDF